MCDARGPLFPHLELFQARPHLGTVTARLGAWRALLKQETPLTPEAAREGNEKLKPQKT